MYVNGLEINHNLRGLRMFSNSVTGLE